jgi:hypothetical protein
MASCTSTGELLGKCLADKHRRWVTECPCCRQLAPETLDHFFWPCALHATALVLDFEFMLALPLPCSCAAAAAAHATFSALSDSDKTTVLLGGVTQTGLIAFADWLNASAPDKHPIYLLVVCFLNSIQSARLPISSMTSCMLQAEALVKEKINMIVVFLMLSSAELVQFWRHLVPSEVRENMRSSSKEFGSKWCKKVSCAALTSDEHNEATRAPNDTILFVWDRYWCHIDGYINCSDAVHKLWSYHVDMWDEVRGACCFETMKFDFTEYKEYVNSYTHTIHG